ncbi:MAG: hypothetical protein ACRDSG_13565, partial [Pseudonocardiaceae bacterium]
AESHSKFGLDVPVAQLEPAGADHRPELARHSPAPVREGPSTLDVGHQRRTHRASEPDTPGTSAGHAG